MTRWAYEILPGADELTRIAAEAGCDEVDVLGALGSGVGTKSAIRAALRRAEQRAQDDRIGRQLAAMRRQRYHTLM